MVYKQFFAKTETKRNFENLPRIKKDQRTIKYSNSLLPFYKEHTKIQKIHTCTPERHWFIG